MANGRYRLTQPAYINDQLHYEGTEIGEGTGIPFDLEPGPHMEPLNAEGKKRAEEAKKAREKRNGKVNVIDGRSATIGEADEAEANNREAGNPV